MTTTNLFSLHHREVLAINHFLQVDKTKHKAHGLWSSPWVNIYDMIFTGRKEKKGY